MVLVLGFQRPVGPGAVGAGCWGQASSLLPLHGRPHPRLSLGGDRRKCCGGRRQRSLSGALSSTLSPTRTRSSAPGLLAAMGLHQRAQHVQLLWLVQLISTQWWLGGDRKLGWGAQAPSFHVILEDFLEEASVPSLEDAVRSRNSTAEARGDR